MQYLYWSLGIIVFIGLMITGIVIYKKEMMKKRKNDILKLFTDACERNHVTEYTLEHAKKETYDYYFEGPNHIYFVKVIYNFANHEICINNAIKWQLRRINENQEKTMFVEGIEALMRFDFGKTSKKAHKLFIIYPNTRALLKVINECEMVFVYPDTDVYGANVVSYKRLVENPDWIEV